MLSVLLSALFPPGRWSKLTILKYHQILTEPDQLFPGAPDVACFDWQMQTLKQYFNVFTLGDAIALFKQGKLPSRAVCVSFDDGYADNYTLALPILKKYQIPATVFVATGLLNGGVMWNDAVVHALRNCPKTEIDLTRLDLPCFHLNDFSQRRDAIETLLPHYKRMDPSQRREKINALQDSCAVAPPTQLMMTDTQLKALYHAGIEIGGHTQNHPVLSHIDLAKARTEIGAGKEYLESLTGGKVTVFAYPYGLPGEDYLSEHVGLLKNMGFSGAVSTSWGVAKPSHDPYQLPRMSPSSRNKWYFMGRMAQNLRIPPRQVPT